MAGTYSRKQHLEMYKHMDSKQKAFMMRLTRLDIIYLYNLLCLSGLFERESAESRIVHGIAHCGEYEPMLDLYIRLKHTTDALTKLEKHFEMRRKELSDD